MHERGAEWSHGRVVHVKKIVKVIYRYHTVYKRDNSCECPNCSKRCCAFCDSVPRLVLAIGLAIVLVNIASSVEDITLKSSNARLDAITEKLTAIGGTTKSICEQIQVLSNQCVKTTLNMNQATSNLVEAVGRFGKGGK